MAILGRSVALRRSALAAVVGTALVLLFGPLLLIPALALVALTYWGHQVVRSPDGERAPHADLALVIVVNSALVLMVQSLLFWVSFTG